MAVKNKSQVHWILNELVMGGMVLETNMSEIMLRIEEQNKIEKEEVRLSLPPPPCQRLDVK